MTRPFDEAKPRTHKAQILQRERAMMAAMAELLALEDEDKLRDVLEEVYGITPEMPQYKAILDAWNGH